MATAIDVSAAVQVEARYRRGPELVTCSLDRLPVAAAAVQGTVAGTQRAVGEASVRGR